MANVWFISDIHAGHQNAIKWRDQYGTEDEHFQHIKANYLKVVTKRDKVFFLGDIAFNKERLYDIADWPGESKVLVCGNHDTEHLTMHDLCNAFDEVHAVLKYKEFWLTHVPVHPDELRGRVNIHGHSHEKLIDDPRYLNVCLEHTNYSPVSLATVREVLSGREG